MKNNIQKYNLIGGGAHGETIEVDDSVTSIDIAIYSDEEKITPPTHTATYTRRALELETSGERVECFGIATDDDTEISALALFLRKLAI